MSIAFIDLRAQLEQIREPVERALLDVVDRCAFIMGPEVAALERAMSAYTGASHTVACANGTDALALVLMAWEIGPGDAVFCPSFTFASTAEIIPWFGASPVFVDIRPDTYNIDPDRLEAAIIETKKNAKLSPKAIIAVDLFGQLADYPRISEIARRHGLKLISDCAQGFGATLNGRHPIDWADAVTFSFFPAKPFGCYGDGGAVQTNDEAIAEIIDSLRIHGKASARDLNGQNGEIDPKYLNVRVGMNSRLDSLQAAVLLEKLKIFPREIDARDKIAARYSRRLAGAVRATPTVIDGGRSVWAQYTVEVDDRDALAAHLKRLGVPTAIYYPMPIHQQKPYARYPQGPGGLPVTNEKAGKVLSLPMHAYLDEATQDRIVAGFESFNRRA